MTTRIKGTKMLETPRLIMRSDIARVIQCEESHVELDPDFGVETIRSGALDEAALLKLIEQRRDEKANTYDTRTLVVEAKVTAFQRQLVGAVTYEIQPDGYEIIFLTVHADAPPETRAELVKALMGKVDRNDKLRKNVRMYVRDGDWDMVRTLQGLGWSLKLVADHFPGSVDAYLCAFCSKTSGKSGAEPAEAA
jgi:hypothetical protein